MFSILIRPSYFDVIFHSEPTNWRHIGRLIIPCCHLVCGTSHCLGTPEPSSLVREPDPWIPPCMISWCCALWYLWADPIPLHQSDEPGTPCFLVQCHHTEILLDLVPDLRDHLVPLDLQLCQSCTLLVFPHDPVSYVVDYWRVVQWFQMDKKEQTTTLNIPKYKQLVTVLNFYVNFFLEPAKKTRPVPKRSNDVGSGTGATCCVTSILLKSSDGPESWLGRQSWIDIL